MAVTWKAVNNALAIYDADYPHRWYDAFGVGVVKYLQDFATLPSDDTTGDPTEWEVTIVEIGANDSTAVITDLAGGALLIETAGNENDGWSMQLGAAAGENILLDGNDFLYFGTKLALNDATDTDFWVGVAVTDTALLGGVTDGISFRKVDASTTVSFVVENTNVEDSIAAGTVADDGYVELEFLYDGENVTGYFNGQEVGRVNKSSVAFPDDQEMRLSFEFLTGEAVQNTCTVQYLRMIYISD